MNTKPTFVIRNVSKPAAPVPIDAAKILEHYLSLHLLNTVNTSSLLYNSAVRQYNTNVKNTTIRPTIPSWFCGKVNPTTDELITPPTDEVLRASSGFVLDPTVDTEPVILSPSTGYAVDGCLYYGTPGSHGYTLCSLAAGAAEEDYEVSGIDWLASMSAELQAQEEALSEEVGDDGATTSKKKKKTTLFPIIDLLLGSPIGVPVVDRATKITDAIGGLVKKTFTSLINFF